MPAGRERETVTLLQWRYKLCLKIGLNEVNEFSIEVKL